MYVCTLSLFNEMIINNKIINHHTVEATNNNWLIQSQLFLWLLQPYRFFE